MFRLSFVVGLLFISFGAFTQHNWCGTDKIQHDLELANPELDQLAGRFGNSRGRVGFMVCRSLQDKQLFQKRCKDTAVDGRGYIIFLDDSDLKSLVEEKKKDNKKMNYDLLRKKFDELIN